jgi:N-acetyl-gamma-glutamyl-phosphate reductase
MKSSANPAQRSRAFPREPAKVSVGVFGASGTSGSLLVALLERHPHVRVAFATSRAEAGRSLDEIDPAAPEIVLQHPDHVDRSCADLVFLAVPHGTSGRLAPESLAHGARVIDLSGDHRLGDAATHERVYGSERQQSIANDAVYGLTELTRANLPAARIVANPGCYATAVNLALVPLAEAGHLRDLPTIDAKSGVSGAGRTPTETSHFCSAVDDVRPYKPGRAHRHVAEIEQLLTHSDPTGRAHRIIFNPHLVPIERGIEATIVLRASGDADALRRVLERRYEGEPFVRVLPAGREARIRGVARTNRAHLAVFPVEGVDAVVVTVAIDNLLKGAAGQAVQNMNVMLGLPETTGLPGARAGDAVSALGSLEEAVSA